MNIQSEQGSTESQRRYTCAFCGRRDGYQAPIALDEAGRLSTLLTDFYVPGWMLPMTRALPDAWARKIRARHSDALDDRRVRSRLDIVLRERIERWFRVPEIRIRVRTAIALSRAAARAAARSRTNLLLYHSYAWEAFTTRYAHAPRKVLFPFHPHESFRRRLYAEDAARYPDYAALDSPTAFERIDPPLRTRFTDAWRHADLILCTSSITRDSFVAAGADPARCAVVPYGIDAHALADAPRPDPTVFQALFVGSGTPHKGLHHLLLAWAQLNLPTPKRLVVVGPGIHPGIGALLERTPDVEYQPWIDHPELDALYARSHLFIMPSLIEGFGQVYLEALAAGCPVLGTANTGLPDLGGEPDGIFLAPAGDPDALAARIAELAPALMSNSEHRAHARRCAERHPWARFRRGLIDALDALDHG